MIEALVRVVLEIVLLPMVQGLGYVALRGLGCRKPTETACTSVGLLGWGGITWGVLATLGAL